MRHCLLLVSTSRKDSPWSTQWVCRQALVWPYVWRRYSGWGCPKQIIVDSWCRTMKQPNSGHSHLSGRIWLPQWAHKGETQTLCVLISYTSDWATITHLIHILIETRHEECMKAVLAMFGTAILFLSWDLIESRNLQWNAIQQHWWDEIEILICRWPQPLNCPYRWGVNSAGMWPCAQYVCSGIWVHCGLALGERCSLG